MGAHGSLKQQFSQGAVLEICGGDFWLSQRSGAVGGQGLPVLAG